MRHKVRGRKLHRDHQHRKAMFKNMCNSLLRLGRIRTGHVKAKELRKYVEPLITKAKLAYKLQNEQPEKFLHYKRLLFNYLQDETTVNKLIKEIAPNFLERNGGYTRILRLMPRPGDNSPMAIIELITDEVVDTKKGKGKKKSKKMSAADKVKQPAPKAMVESKANQENLEKSDKESAVVPNGKSTEEETSNSKTNDNSQTNEDK